MVENITYSQSDYKLVAAAKKDLRNFKALYEKYLTSVFRYCYNRVGRKKEMAEDITSEVFTKAIEKFDKFQWQGKPFVAWLYTLAHNLIVDYYRAQGKAFKLSYDSLEIDVAEEKEDIIDDLSKDELKGQLNVAIGTLPEDLKHIFTLKHSQDLTFAEIAELLGRTEGAVKMQYYRGIEACKKEISLRFNKGD